MDKLFCDLKTDEEKSNFFLSGRGYETGVIASAIQNDVAMAYHRCAEYKKELEALQSQGREDDPLQPAANWLIQAIESCTVADIQGRLSIGYNRAQRLFDHARRVEGESAEQSDDGLFDDLEVSDEVRRQIEWENRQ